MEDAIKKKLSMRHILKKLVDEKFKEMNEQIKHEINEELRLNITSTLEVVKRKISAIKKLEDEIVDITDNENQMAVILTESTDYEIETKKNITFYTEFINTKFPKSTDVKIRSSQKLEEPQPQVKLPRLTIRTFTGDPTKWQTFIDSFEAAINSSTRLNSIDKFNYLLEYLEGDALQTISGLGLTNQNYEKALDLLKTRYGNPQLIITAHMNELLQLKKVVSDRDLAGLRTFFDKIESHVRSLQSLGIESKNYGSLLAPIILERLPHQFKLVVCRNVKDQIWDLDKILELINEELRARESCIIPVSSPHGIQKTGSGKNDLFDSVENYSQSTGSALYSNDGNKNKCVFCRGHHWSDKCKVISEPEARKEYLKKGNRCFLCLNQNHISRNCPKTKTCYYCKGLHNSAICHKNIETLGKSGNNSKEETNSHSVYNKTPILLQTAEIYLGNPQDRNKSLKIRALLDSGAQRTYCSERVMKILNLQSKGKENISLNTFANSVSKESLADTVEIKILSSDKSEPELFNLSALVLPLICLPIKNQPLKYAQSLPEFAGLNFADSGTNGNEIDLLVGSDTYWKFVTGNVKQMKGGTLVAIETIVGWVFNGPINISDKSVNMNFSSNDTHVVLSIDKNIPSYEKEISSFWDLETLGIKSDEQFNDERFHDIIKLNEQNRYEAKLPFKQDHPLISDNYNLCKNRLMKLHSKLKDNPELLKQYDDIFKNQKNLGIIEEVKEPGKKGEVCYLPHHCVLRDDKETSKVRVVFDASSKDTGPSLNECLHKGPQNTPLLFDILLRFRTFEIALVADIEKAFLQIGISEGDRNFLRFLWFDDVFSDQPKIVRNRFARVIFGVTSSPFLLNETIREHVKKYEFDAEFVCKVFESFYVDDFVSGENSFEKTLELYKKLKIRFIEGLFNLTKWKTNNNEIRKLICDKTFTENRPPEKVLGILWDEKKDVFIYSFNDICELYESLPFTKRNVLKTLATFFDPIGACQPIVVKMKIIFQEICKLSIDWDDELPQNLKQRFDNIINLLKTTGKVEIPRYLFKDNPSEGVELHGFSDASLQAYGAVIYSRHISSSGEIVTNLITSKSRVAPLKPTTIPRLELLGNLILARLMNSVENALKTKIEIKQRYFYTDSQITLNWILADTKVHEVFVENRIKEIRNISNKHDWYYCSTKNNSADILTRAEGNLENFSENQFWWKGAQFLSESFIKFEQFSHSKNLDVYTSNLIIETKNEFKNITLSNLVEINRFSCLQKLYRVTGWVYRFCRNIKIKSKEKRDVDPFLSPKEINNAEIEWIKVNQLLFKKDKLETLKRELNLVVDENNLYRCKGRLSESPLPYDVKTPILIHSEHRLAELIVTDLHVKLKHISIKQTLTELRQKFWICQGRNFVRKILHKCYLCRKYSGPSYQYPESPPLTPLRMDNFRAYNTVGIDNFGPVFVKNIYNNETGNTYKAWITLYTCASSRAILLDLVPNMTSQAFIKSIRRFICRRGCPSNAISDNGKNFVSVDTQSYVSNLGISWHVNTPLAPWHGGFFERLVRSVKELLRKELKCYKLSFEELQTVLLEIECILNNRPLTYYYPSEIEPCLTPNHLLFGRTVNLFNNDQSEIIQNNVDIVVQSRKIINLINHFWGRWHKEYLCNLREYQRQSKVKSTLPIININDIVLVYEEKIPRSRWRLGQVIELIYGRDNRIRSANVKLSKTHTVITRPINHLYPIEQLNP